MRYNVSSWNGHLYTKSGGWRHLTTEPHKYLNQVLLKAAVRRQGFGVERAHGHAEHGNARIHAVLSL